MKAMFPSTQRDFSKFSDVVKEITVQHTAMRDSVSAAMNLPTELDYAFELKAIGEFYSDVFRNLEGMKKKANIKL